MKYKRKKYGDDIDEALKDVPDDIAGLVKGLLHERNYPENFNSRISLIRMVIVKNKATITPIIVFGAITLSCYLFVSCALPLANNKALLIEPAAGC